MKNSFSNRSGAESILPKIIIILFAVILFSRLILNNSSIFYRKNMITPPFSLHLNKSDVVMIKGEEMHLSVFGLNKRVSFHSTNFLVAGVNFTGRVYAYRTGKAFIIAKVGNKKLKCRVRVININKRKIKLKKGHHYTLRIKGPGGYVSWKSSNTKVASVSLFGNVKAKQIGTAVITAKVKNKNIQCYVQVK